MSTLRGARSFLREVRVGIGFLLGLRHLLRNPIAPAEARAALAQRRERRNAEFLVLARDVIYAEPANPITALLRSARCEYGDLEHLVEQEGIEGALFTLFRHGVYLTEDELKGRRLTVRGSTTLHVDQAQLRNPQLGVKVIGQTSGSTGRRAPIAFDFATVKEETVPMVVLEDTLGSRNHARAIWNVPGAAALGSLLQTAVLGGRTARWFSQIPPASKELHPRYRWSARVLRLGGRLASVPIPAPEHVSLDDPGPIVEWMAETLRAGERPWLQTYSSAAVRVCEAANAAGIDLRGADIVVGGEPISSTRRAEVDRSGARLITVYGSMEVGRVANGCLNAEVSDEVHVFDDMKAVIQVGRASAECGLPPDALLISPIRWSAHLPVLNLSVGDQATLLRRSCGCPLEKLGWLTHLHTIRSFTKLTAGGMTFPDTDIIPVLEQVLPQRFGGGPTDYQLIEAESTTGEPRLTLLVHPRIGPVDEEQVYRVFLEKIGRGTGVERVMEMMWRNAGFLTIERRAPASTMSGKIQHVYAPRTGPLTRPSRA